MSHASDFAEDLFDNIHVSIESIIKWIQTRDTAQQQRTLIHDLLFHCKNSSLRPAYNRFTECNDISIKQNLSNTYTMISERYQELLIALAPIMETLIISFKDEQLKQEIKSEDVLRNILTRAQRTDIDQTIKGSSIVADQSNNNNNTGNTDKE